MSDCCSQLKIEVAALRAEIAKLKPIDEESIINKAVDKMKLLLPAIIGGVVAAQLAPALKDIISAKKAADTALSTANSLGGKLGELAGKVAGIAAALFALGSTIAILNVLGNRIDGLEASLGFTNAAVSKALGLIGEVKGIATKAESKADTANQGVSDNRAIDERLSGEVSDTKSLARTALQQAIEGIRRADLAKAFADRAAEIANIGITGANLANSRLNDLEPFVEMINDVNLQQTSWILQVNNAANQLKIDLEYESGRINNIEIQIPGISAKASQAQGIAETANANSETAYQEAIAAQGIAELANTKAQSALLDIAKANGKITRLEQKDVELEGEITQAQQEAYAAAQLGGLGLTIAQNTAQGLSNVQGRVGVVGGIASGADAKASDALGRISQIKDGVVTNPAIQNAIAQPIGRINDTQQKQAEKIRQIEEKIANPGGVNTREVSRPEFEQIKEKLRETDKVNQEGTRKLDEILSKLPALPAMVAARVPSVPQIKQAVGSAMCESAQPGGCVGGALNNQADGIKNDFGQKLRDLEQGLNAGANAAQLTLLNTINTKLGAEVVGGISGSLSKFYSWAHVDRILNVLTFAATIHNAMMLSNDIAATLTQALSNVLQVIGIKDKDGSPLDLGAIIGSSVENAIKGVIGAENYTELSQTFAKANRIYQSSTNVLMSVTNIGHSMTNALEIVGGMNGKIGNALRVFGVVGEKAYEWFNPQPNYHSRILRFFETAQEGANTIAAVTQAPLDVINAVTEFNNSTTELVKSVKEDPEVPNKGAKIEDAQLIKQERDEIKTLSQGALTGLSDIFNANE